MTDILRASHRFHANVIAAQRAARDNVTGTAEPDALLRIRTFLLATLGLGIIGTALELVLLGHVDSVTQWIPLVLLAAGAAVVAWHARAPGGRTVRALRVTMVAFIAAGGLGVGLHYKGNVEFQREIDPSAGGFEFFRKTIAGATPVFAPGAMVLLGLIGLTHAYRHPDVEGET